MKVLKFSGKRIVTPKGIRGCDAPEQLLTAGITFFAMSKKKQPPLNIWNDIEKTWSMRLDIVFEGSMIVGIHNSDIEDVISSIDMLCRKLQIYKSEMEVIYKNRPPEKRSLIATYIYLIRDNNTGLVKIGRSIDPSLREKTIQSENPNLDLFWISPITQPKTEKKLHIILKDKRIRGEWFDLTDGDIEIIKTYHYATS
jgi:hypothetical protein